MRTITAVVVAGALLAACHASQDSGAAARVRNTVGDATLSVPKAWAMRLPTTEAERQVWSPDPGANPAKETLAIRIAPRRERMSDDEILAAAMTAQGLLPGVKVLDSQPMTTKGGLKALWIETSFQPAGATATYRRSHVTAIGKTHVFHLFYTAASPDPALQVLHDAIDSLKEEG